MEVLKSTVAREASGGAPAVSRDKMAEVAVLKSEAAPEQGKVSEDQVRHAVEHANKVAQAFDRSLKFEYRREANIYQVSVIDTTKDEVVRKIPPDEVVRFMERIGEIFGALFDVNA
ncbi:MAG: flagellar protein FlaG [Aminivibrio sp.]|jgi:uncharacterized FlaG/YvyC family protein